MWYIMVHMGWAIYRASLNLSWWVSSRNVEDALTPRKVGEIH